MEYCTLDYRFARDNRDGIICPLILAELFLGPQGKTCGFLRAPVMV